MTKVVLAGTSTYSIENQGDDALLEVFCRELRNNMPDVEITLLSRHPSKAFDELFGVKSIKNVEHETKEESIGRWFWGLNPGDPTDHLREIIKAIDECDLLVIGGDPFTDQTQGFLRGLGPYAALLVTLAKFSQKPIMLYSLHLTRPLQTEIGKEIARYCVGNSDLVTIREEFTRQGLIDLGISDRNFHVLSDGAFGLNPIQGREQGNKILEREGIHIKAEKVIGIAFRHYYWIWNDKDWEYYSTMLADVYDYMIEALDVDLLFIANCTYDLDHEYDDDRRPAKDTVAKMKFKERTHQVKNKYSLYEVLSLFPLTDMLVSNRRHALIFGAVHGIPPVGMGIEWHMKPFMDELSLGDSFVKIDDISPELLKLRIKQTWDDRESIAQNIGKLMPDLREKALQHAKLAADLIKNK
ncbi:polysaccharide pyruvyl transferase family protein [Chloroflexota bacterium]